MYNEEFKWDKNNPHIPVDGDGNWLQYAEYYGNPKPKPHYVQPFQANLRIKKFNKGRAAAYFTVVNVDTGVEMPMWATDFVDYLQNATVIDGVFSGTWAVKKKGANYGVYHV